jgi:aminomethyltransferase
MYMPTSYTSPVEEYWSLVNDVTMWDVSCERQIEITGPDAHKLVQFLTPRDVSNCKVGLCLYVVLTHEKGGIVNDAILLRIGPEQFWISPGDGDVLLWIAGVAVNSGMNVNISEPDVSPLQLGGPKAPKVMNNLFGDWVLNLGYYHAQETTLNGIPLIVARTGWSGELSYELYLRDRKRGDELWELVFNSGKKHNITPIAPSHIRSIEGGILSYGQDITWNDNPYVVGLGRLVNLEQSDNFIGKTALKKIKKEDPKRKLVGVEIQGDPIMNPPEYLWSIYENSSVIGHVTRCGYSPRLEKNIGYANIPIEYSNIGSKVTVSSPTGDLLATVCKMPWFQAEKKISETN